jgi:hypothetical protein
MPEAALKIFQEQQEAFREVLAGLPDEAVSWRPGPETNSIAVLIEHTWGSAAWWTARAAGREIERDRDAEFRATRGVAELEELLAARLRRIEEHVGAIDPATFGELEERSNRTRAWCLLHAIDHAGGHLGQAQLTRQLWQQRNG